MKSLRKVGISSDMIKIVYFLYNEQQNSTYETSNGDIKIVIIQGDYKYLTAPRLGFRAH